MFQFGVVQRTRITPFHDHIVAAGVKSFTVYNHMLLPTSFGDPEAEYWNLINNVAMWDVACERQVEIKGRDAFKLVTLITPRDISKCAIGQGKYVPLCDENGGVINDPILLRLAEDHFWLSIADTDVLLWAKGLATGLGLDVQLCEPDVGPLAVQGPNANKVCADLLGDWIYELNYFWFREVDLDGIPLLVQRSGWSKQGGLELYLRDSAMGGELWERVAQAGKPYGIQPGNPNGTERIEMGLLSHGNDITFENNPFEVGMGKYCALRQSADFLAKEALQHIKATGIKRKIMGVVLPDVQVRHIDRWRKLSTPDGAPAGEIRSLTWSPRLQQTIAFAMLPIEHCQIDTPLVAHLAEGDTRALVRQLPFIK